MDYQSKFALYEKPPEQCMATPALLHLHRGKFAQGLIKSQTSKNAPYY